MVTIAELAKGPHAGVDDLERERRRQHFGQVESSLSTLPFDIDCARAYGPVCAAVEHVGRKVRGSRAVDLMIAATALAHDLPLYTLNSSDLRGLEGLIEIVDVADQSPAPVDP